MSLTRLTYLLQRYFEDTASQEEVDEVMILLEDSNNEEEIEMVMDHYWREHEAPTPVFSSGKSKSMLDGILTAHNSHVSHQVQRKKNWLYAAAAAVILLLGSAVLYKFVLTKATLQNIAKSNTINTDVAPGGYKAVLTLADKSTIVLENSENGVLTLQGKTKIVKQDNGQLAYIPSNEKDGELLYNIISTPRGGEYQLTLSDGSKAWLNAASSLRFPATFVGTERKVEITGEVYFEVAKNVSRPFIVNVAGKGEVKVLGTHFNINAYGDESSVKTTLLEGSVIVSSINTQASRIIAPGEQIQLIANGQLILNKNVNTDQVMAWKNGLFNFSNADLHTIIRQLSRWYDVDVAFEGPIPQKKFGGELQRDLNLSQVLRLLEKNDVHFRIEGKKLVLLNK